MSLILASNSPRRRELLAAAGIDFTVECAEVEELVSAADPRSLPERNAELKAAAVADRHPQALVLGADTVILHRNRIIGKPASPDEALAILLELSGHTHEVITAVALIRQSPPLHLLRSEITRLTFKPFDEATARRYLELVHVLDKAGAYALQEHGEMLVDSVEGESDNVVGLPLRAVRELLIQAGVE